jgi:membrane fusion protein (multidrug efflux system)
MPLPQRIALALLLLAPALLAAKDPKPAETAASPPLPVIASEVHAVPFADPVEALGTLKARESVSITANVTETVSAIHFDDGQRVKKGDILVEMTGTEEHALIEEGKARVAEAERQYDRVKSLAGQRSAAESLLDERRRDLETARAALAAIESRLADRLIKASFDGVLGLRNISVGALVEPSDLITTLDDTSTMKLDFTVPSVFLPDLKPGLAVTARAREYGELAFRGTVSGVDSRIDPVTRSIQVRALIPNPDGRLKPGLLMQVELERNPREGLVVPESALLQQGQDHFVVRVGEGDKAERVKVRIGARRRGQVEIVEGLTPGDRVVTHGNDKARPGQSLSVRMDDGSRPLKDLLGARGATKP